MTHLDDDFIALTRKRVLDVSAILGMTVQVVFNGHKTPLFEHFGDYVYQYIKALLQALRRVCLFLNEALSQEHRCQPC